MKHKNTSKWARRALKRGVNVMDDGMRGAIAEQLRLGQELRQKVRGCLWDSPSAVFLGTPSDGSLPLQRISMKLQCSSRLLL